MNYEFKGTHGEWIYEYDTCDITPTEYYTIYSNKGNIFSRNYNERDFQQKEMEANALLCSKAPLLLEALIKCERTLREVYECDTTELKELLHSATNI